MPEVTQLKRWSWVSHTDLLFPPGPSVFWIGTPQAPGDTVQVRLMTLFSGSLGWDWSNFTPDLGVPHKLSLGDQSLFMLWLPIGTESLLLTTLLGLAGYHLGVGGKACPASGPGLSQSPSYPDPAPRGHWRQGLQWVGLEVPSGWGVL